MAITGKFIFTASMDVDPAKEDLFNEVYDKEHIPNLLKVPGVVAATRVVNQDFAVNMAGEVKEVSLRTSRSIRRTMVESPDMTSQAWADAIEEGRWPTEVRPHTRNRRHVQAGHGLTARRHAACARYRRVFAGVALFACGLMSSPDVYCVPGFGINGRGSAPSGRRN